MKKITILCVVALLCLKKSKAERLKPKAFLLITLLVCLLNGQLIAQVPKPIKIGDKLPPIFWQQKHQLYTGGNPNNITFQQFKGKAMLLDFWATWCSPCLKSFPKMNGLQNQHGKYLNILMVNAYEQDTQAVLASFYKKQQETISGFSLKVIQSDTNLRTTFPIKGMPHYIWVGADGRIKAITDAEAITEVSIKRFIAGLAINLKVKEN